uniref:Peptidase A2 domain-containing protein n=1 Tax=Biomphalaria glabrata TaxID=6526 RepID=A0A2C9LZR7_BIOGL
MKIDTGAQANVISESTWNTSSNASSPNARRGVVSVKFKVGDLEVKDDLYVIKKSINPILGLKTSIALKLIEAKRNVEVHDVKQQNKVPQVLMKKYKRKFEGLGTYKMKYHIKLTSDAKPVIQCARRVSTSLYEELKRKLAQLQQDGVITEVDEPTEWVYNLVKAKKKDNSLRLCLDA